MAAAALFSYTEGYAQDKTVLNDSTVNTIRIQNLQVRRTALRKQIAAEDKKRNTVIEGVSPEALEERNDRQDSICLELRSELVAVNLELQELGADNQIPQLVQRYNSLVHGNRPDSTQTPAPVIPAKPTRKE